MPAPLRAARRWRWRPPWAMPGILVAADVRARRVRLLADTVGAAGAACARVVQANAAQALPFADIFDCVLVDAPCTGLGTLRRDPDIKWRRAPDDFDAVTALQLRILTTAAAVVRPGGRIVYADLFERAGRERSRGRTIPRVAARVPPGAAALCRRAAPHQFGRPPADAAISRPPGSLLRRGCG